MITKQEIFQTIINNRDTIKKYGINEIGLFGSFVRNEQNDKSDIDFLIDYDKDKISLKNHMGFCYFLDELFADKKVEVVSKNGLSKYIGPYILKEVEYVEI